MVRGEMVSNEIETNFINLIFNIMENFNEHFRQRTLQFALDIIIMSKKIPVTEEGQIIKNQIIRCATSVGANFRAVTRARSKREYYSKMCIVVEEADETIFWLELIEKAKLISNLKNSNLFIEANELLSVFSKSKKTAKINLIKSILLFFINFS